MQIHAVKDDQAFSIEAALAHPAIKLNARLLASIGIERPTAHISMRELEAKMAAANLPTKRSSNSRFFSIGSASSQKSNQRIAAQTLQTARR